MGRPRSSIEIFSCEESTCEGGWRRPDIPAGSNDYWQSWDLRCGSAIPRRSRPGASRSKRPTRQDAQLLLKLMMGAYLMAVDRGQRDFEVVETNCIDA